MLKGEIIAVGTELLLGQIANTNAQFISQRLADIGVPVYYHQVVGDNWNRLEQAIHLASQRSNMIIFTGGLGPTQDDITKEVAAKYLKKEIVLDQGSYEKIIAFFQNRKIPMTENNKRQALVINGSSIFANNHGLAPGIGIEANGIYYLFLPGPPKEMKPMFTEYALPWIQTIYGENTFYSKVMRFAGIGESALEEEVIDLIERQTIPTIAPLAGEGEVTLRLTAQGKSKQEAMDIVKPVEEEIHKRLKDYHFGDGTDEIEKVVLQLLQEKGLMISVSESCTGGLIGSKLTSLPGSSSVYAGGIICYSNEIKHKLLHVPKEVLREKGAVSEETATILANETLRQFNTDIAISITGITGPDSVEGKPVGLVYMGFSRKGRETIVEELHFSGSRVFIQQRISKHVFYTLWKTLKSE